MTKAYPVNILNWHEIVNDRFNGLPVAITFCPLCGSGIAYLAEIDGIAHTFGVSCLLKGQRLQSIPLSHTTWQDWKTRHPDTLVLSPDTGYARDYRDNPYTDYINSPQLLIRYNSEYRTGTILDQ